MFHTFHEQVSPMEVPRIGNDATEVVLTHVLPGPSVIERAGCPTPFTRIDHLVLLLTELRFPAFKLLFLHLPLDEGFIKFGMLLREGGTTIKPRIFRKTKSWVQKASTEGNVTRKVKIKLLQASLKMH
jgi:hypothetical protein